MKRPLLDSWSAREQLALASAVENGGDRNWVVVSRFVRSLCNEGERPSDWFSTKNCALQYTQLLEGIVPPKRRRISDASGDHESQEKMLLIELAKRYKVELSEVLERERAEYMQLRNDLKKLEAGLSNEKLNAMWEQMEEEEKHEAESRLKYDIWSKDREKEIAIASKTGFKAANGAPNPITPNGVLHDPLLSCESVSQNNNIDGNDKAELSTPPKDSLNDDFTLSVNRQGESSLSSFLPDISSVSEPTVVSDSSAVDEKGSFSLTVWSGLANDSAIKDEEKLPKMEVIEAKTIPSTDLVIKENKMIITGQGMSDDNESSESFAKLENLDLDPPKVTKIEKKSEIWDDDSKELCSEVLQLGDVQRKYSRIKKFSHDYKVFKKEDSVENTPSPSSECSIFGTENIEEIDEKKDVQESGNVFEVEGEEEDNGFAGFTSLPGCVSGAEKSAMEPTIGMQAAALEIEDSPVKMVELKQLEEESYKSSTIFDTEDTDSVDNESTASNLSLPSLQGVKRKHTPCSSPSLFEEPDSPASVCEEPEQAQIVRLWRKSVMILWHEIAAHKFAGAFLRPITEDKVPGYPAVVKRPMDLQTIKRNIECGHTRNTAEFQRDIMLMATNAVFYNARGHNLHDRANCLLRDALAKIEEFESAASAQMFDSPIKKPRRRGDEGTSKSRKRKKF